MVISSGAERHEMPQNIATDATDIRIRNRGCWMATMQSPLSVGYDKALHAIVIVACSDSDSTAVSLIYRGCIELDGL